MLVRVVVHDTGVETSISVKDLRRHAFSTKHHLMTDEDDVSFKSQIMACSQNKLILTPTKDRTSTSGNSNIQQGVVTVHVNSDAQGAAHSMTNLVTRALQEQFQVQSPLELANFVMYCLPPGSTPMTGGATTGEAYINSGLSVHKDDWCMYLSQHMQLIGYNLGLGPANDLVNDGNSVGSQDMVVPHGDQTGMVCIYVLSEELFNLRIDRYYCTRKMLCHDFRLTQSMDFFYSLSFLHSIFLGPRSDRVAWLITFSIWSSYSRSYVSTWQHSYNNTTILSYMYLRTTQMGFVYRALDAPQMCYNAAQMYHLGWYDGQLGIWDKFTQPGTLVLHGFTKQGNKNAFPKLVNFQWSSQTDLYMSFNWKQGFNQDTQEAANQVTLVQQGSDGIGYSASLLKAKLGEHERFVFENFFDEPDAPCPHLDIRVDAIDLEQGQATITIQTCPPPVEATEDANGINHSPRSDCNDNGKCEAFENCQNCPLDCASHLVGNEFGRFCCDGGPIILGDCHINSCEDARCAC